MLVSKLLVEDCGAEEPEEGLLLALEGVVLSEGGVEGAGEGRWKPSVRERT